MGSLQNETKVVLAEYRAIGKEYKSLDKANPDHLPRRMQLKTRYHELNKQYGRLREQARGKTEPPAKPLQVVVSVPGAGEPVPDKRPKPRLKRSSRPPVKVPIAEITEKRAVAPPPESVKKREDAPPADESEITLKVLALGGWTLVTSGAALAASFLTGMGREAVLRIFEAIDLQIVAELQYGLIASGTIAVLGATLIGCAAFARRVIRLVVPLHDLARTGRLEPLERAIARGMDIDAPDRRGCTPLHFAVVAGQEAAASILLANGAKLEVANDRGETPLFMAAANRDLALLEFLIGKGANVRARNGNGSTLMHVAASVGDLDLMQAVGGHGLDPQARTHAGYTPLHFAAQSGNADVVKILLRAGADPDGSCDSGSTPLCAATRNGHLRIIRLLIGVGAHVNVKDGCNYPSPLTIAHEFKHNAVAELLRKHGATSKRAQPAA